MAIVARASCRFRVLLALAAWLVLPWLLAPGAVRAEYALAWGDTPKYPPGFAHFGYVNPDAPKGGTLNLAGFGSFDKLNPFTLRRSEEHTSELQSRENLVC